MKRVKKLISLCLSAVLMAPFMAYGGGAASSPQPLYSKDFSDLKAAGSLPEGFETVKGPVTVGGLSGGWKGSDASAPGGGCPMKHSYKDDDVA